MIGCLGLSTLGTNMARQFRTLNLEEKNTKKQLSQELRVKRDSLNEAIDNFNSQVEAAIAELWKDVEVSVEQYNEAVEETNKFVEQVAQEQEKYYSSCEDVWRDGESGSTYMDWINDWNIVVERIDPDCPTLEVGNLEVDIETFEGLPHKVTS